MKSSVKFREEKGPLIRMKLPFKLGPLPFSSGIAVGTKQDLAVHFATGFLAGPVIKLAVRPHDPNPLSVILKTGLGSWGSPNDAPLTVTAEICINLNGHHEPLLSLRLKPRAGDFSIRKDVRNVNFAPFQKKEAGTVLAPIWLQVHDSNKVEGLTPSPRGRENGLALNLLPNGGAKPACDASGPEKENLHMPSVDLIPTDTGSNMSVKIERLEKGRNDRKPNTDLPKELNVEADLLANGNSMVVQLPYERLWGRKKLNSRKFAASFSLAGARDALSGSKIVMHSSLPLGSQARLNVRWGAKSMPNLFHGWDGSLPSLSFSKLPSLILDKVSLERVASPLEKASGPPATTSSEQGLLPVSFVEENRELAQVASMCFTMKRQLHLMHAENQVLRRAMEDMRSQVESNGLWMSTVRGESMPHTNSDSSSKLPQKSSILDVPLPPPQQGREGTQRNLIPKSYGGGGNDQAQKVQKAKPKKEDDFQVKSSVTGDGKLDLSKELERAILSAQTGSAAGKKD